VTVTTPDPRSGTDGPGGSAGPGGVSDEVARRMAEARRAADIQRAAEARRATEKEAARQRAADGLEKRTERQMWWYLAYFLFGIHLVALVMIFAVRHGH
jgi:hypothetical protein